MDKMTCKTCGCESLQPMQVVFEEDEDDSTPDDGVLDEDQESRFYSCQVCGDNWLMVKEKTPDGTCTVTFVHQMGTSPVLKRVAHMNNAIVIDDENVEAWEYFLGEEEVEEDRWRNLLSDRRETLKSTCVN